MNKISKEIIEETQIISVLPLRDVVVYPHMVVPLFVGREMSINALENALLEENKQVLLVAQKNLAKDDLDMEDIYSLGTISNVLQLIKLPNGRIKLLVEGEQRAKITEFFRDDQGFKAKIIPLSSNISDTPIKIIEILSRSVISQFEHYLKLNKKIPVEILDSLIGIEDPSRLADTIAAHIIVKQAEKQEILEIIEVQTRLEYLIALIESEIDLLRIEKRIRKRVKGQMDKNQHEYYLNEQIKAIQKELGESEDLPDDINELAAKIEAVNMSKEAKIKVVSEFNKLKMMSPMSSEATVVRSYIDVMLDVPWKKRTKICRNLNKAKDILEADHHGLEEVKERILEYLAVQLRVTKMKGPVLCLVGAPGVGKTSLGQSIARATNRKFIRMSVGGVRDETEIRGHRRTYIGSLPGKIIYNLSKVGVRNPLFLLDEIDKIGMDYRGDPASSLLEVLDPEQNHTFNDHYLEVDYNLSEVMFIATANTLKIPWALRDRMEIINISGYTEDEKWNIAEQYLIPKQIKNNGLKNTEINFHKEAIYDIIRAYTRESGVRNLEREVAKICRKVVKEILINSNIKTSSIVTDNLNKYLGVKKFRSIHIHDLDRIGQVTGLAWTRVGGELLTIEAVTLAGKGGLSYTGQLGNVMQESIRAAMIVVRARSHLLGINSDFYQKNDIHIHVPEGATPKDGPSAGIGMCIAIVSALTNIPVRANIAMTGEITLRGEILPIGGLKEKLLAALREGIELVLIPKENKQDLADIPENIKSNLNIKLVKWIEEVFELALQKMPSPKELKEEIVTKSTNIKNNVIMDDKPNI